MAFDRNPIARRNARVILQKYAITSPLDYTMEEIINAEGLAFQLAPMDGCAGSIVYANDRGIVTVNSLLTEKTQQRFTAAHELGHFANDRMKNFACSFEDVLGIRKTDPIETAANDFAAELLMPEEWFTPFIQGKKLSAALLKECASYFIVSLSATALRYAEIGSQPAAVIMSAKGIVQWSACNSFFPFKYIPKGYSVNSYSYAHELLSRGTDDLIEHDILADAWFLEDHLYQPNYYLTEFNIPYPRYQSVLTVVME